MKVTYSAYLFFERRVNTNINTTTIATIPAATRTVKITANDTPATAPAARPPEEPVATVGRDVVQKSSVKPEMEVVQEESTAKSTPSMLTVGPAVVVAVTQLFMNERMVVLV